MTTLKVATFNVDGINNFNKRNSIFEKLKEEKIDIIFLQETHVELKNIREVKEHWQGKSIWNPGPSGKSRGTAILFGGNKVTIQNTTTDETGRLIVAKIKIQNDIIQLINIYAPNKSWKREDFFGMCKDHTYDIENTILAGDFNMVEDPENDRVPPRQDKHYTHGMEKLNILKEQHKLYDKWRIQNPSKKCYTWKSRKTNENMKSRIGRIYISQKITLINQEIKEYVYSDHRLLMMKIQIPTKHKKGPGYWKLNTEVLHDQQYVQHIKDIIRENTTEEASTAWWERFKLTIKYESMEYCKKRARQRRQMKEQLERQKDNEKDPGKIQDLAEQILEIEQAMKRGAIIRSREKTILNEEKPSKYFYIQENTRQAKHTITEIHEMNEEDEIVQIYEGDKDILRKLTEYHKELYEKQETYNNAKEVLLNTITTPLTEQQKQELEKPITLQELQNAITDMEKNKAPGLDGLPAEFYVTFLTDIQDNLLQMLNNIFLKQDKQPYSQTKGYIKLIYKNGIIYFITNWRGITLLCVDHKILTKIMTTRLRRVMPYLILEDQTCSVPNRNIFENLYLIRDIIAYSNYKRQPTYIVTYDFQKAFDTVDHTYIKDVLQKYNFGNNYMSFIDNIYTGRTVNILNNGYISKEVPLERGLIQGDPLSLPLFCLMAEPLANLIREQEHIKGYRLPGLNKPTKISQYADDTNTITTDKESIQSTLNAFEVFRQASGCTLNPDKIKGMAIQTNSLPYTNKNIEWNAQCGLKILGVTFFDNDQDSQNINWLQMVRKLEKKFQILKFRNLSLRGKVFILNGTILSKVWFLSTIYEIPRWAWKNKEKKGIEQLIFKFLWGESPPEPIRREIIYLPKEKGGLGLLNIPIQGRSLRLKHIFHIPTQDKVKKWVYLARYWISRKIYNCHEDWKHIINKDAITYVQNTGKNHIPYHYRKLLNDFMENKEELLKDQEKSTKTIYITLTRKVKEEEIEIEGIWQKAFKKTIRWKRIWNNTYTSYNIGKAHDILYKILHNCLPTRTRLKKNKDKPGNYDTKCQICKRSDETTLHLFARCSFAEEIWKRYQYLYQLFLPNIKFNYEEAALTINLQQQMTEKKRKLILTLTETIINELWRSRNKCDKEGITPSRNRSIKMINKNLGMTIQTHYQQHKITNDLKTFEEKFAIDKILCEVDYHKKLNLYLPP